MLLKTVFENQHILALDKPHGMLSVPSRHDDKDPRPSIVKELRIDPRRIWPIHRLDYEVSGLILFAKNAQAHRDLCSVFEDREVLKSYEAVTSLPATTINLPSEFTWQNKLFRGKKRVFEAPHGKIAITQAQANGFIFYGREKVMHWLLWPVTGRPHQLRFHLSQFGCPIIGDSKYGSKITLMANSLALRARSIEIKNNQIAEKYSLPPRLEVISGLPYWNCNGAPN